MMTLQNLVTFANEGLTSNRDKLYTRESKTTPNMRYLDIPKHRATDDMYAAIRSFGIVMVEVPDIDDNNDFKIRFKIFET